MALNRLINFAFYAFISVLITSNTAYCLDTKTEELDFHAPHTKFYFDDTEMDFALSLILGAITNGGCEIGEAYYAMSQIEEGSADSWQEQWIKLAERVEKRGDHALAGRHKTSAHAQYLRASYYYRTSLVSMLPDDDKFRPVAEKCRSLLIKAGSLQTPRLEYIEIPYEDTVLPAYFLKANNDNKPTKTFIMIGGGETFMEDLYFYIARQAHDRGYNFMTVDLPGQGMMPLDGHVFRYDVEVPLKLVVDYALSRKDVDSKYVAMAGISGGGGFVPRAAMFDKRIKAISMNSAVVDAQKVFAQMEIAHATQEEMNEWTQFKKNTMVVIGWRWGVSSDNLAGLVKANEKFTFNPKKVTCPALCIIGEGEYQDKNVQWQQKECMDNLSNPNKKMIITPNDEGASNHCIMENRSVMSQSLFDWLDSVFGIKE